MITRRLALSSGGRFVLAGVVASLGFAHADPPQATREVADRDLTLRLADGFRRQTWTYRGKAWDERNDAITLYKGELVRLTVVNDTRDAVELPAAGPFHGAKLRAGETKTLPLRVQNPTGFDLQAISQGEGLTRACTRQLRHFEVRSS
jgi:hypothetical protein